MGSNFGQSFAVTANVAIDIMVMPDEVKIEQISA